MTPDQLRMLTAELPDGVTETKPGGGNKIYLKTGYVINRLNQVFGFDGWYLEVLKSEVVKMWEGGNKHNVLCTANVRLTVFGKCTEYERVIREDIGTGFNKQGDLAQALDTSLKGAVSDGLKRCARTWGTQFGVFDQDSRRADPRWWAGDAQAAVEDRMQRKREIKVTVGDRKPALPPQESRIMCYNPQDVPEGLVVPVPLPGPVGDHRQRLSKRFHASVHELAKIHNLEPVGLAKRLKSVGYKSAEVVRAAANEPSTWVSVPPPVLKRLCLTVEDMQAMPTPAAVLDHLAGIEAKVGL